MDYKDEIAWGFHWCLGYVGLWAGKWILASAILQDNIIQNAIEQIGFRSGVGQDVIYVTVLKENIEVFSSNGLYQILFFAFLLIVVYQLGQGVGSKKIREMVTLNMPFVFVAAIPFIWYFIAKNHSDIHTWFTSRNLAITVFALNCCLANNRWILKGRKNAFLDK